MFKSYQAKRRNRRMEHSLNQKAMMAELLYQQSALHSDVNGTGNTADDDIIVSFTSFNQRIDNVFLTVESLLQQSLKPDRIILWLSTDNFPNKDSDLPLTLLKQKTRGLEIQFVDGDIGPYKKIIYSVQQYPNSLILTVDDDILYPVDLVEQLYKNYQKDPKYIHSNRGHRINFDKNGNVMPYAKWPKSVQDNKAAKTLFPTGNAGVLYFPGCFHKDIADQSLFMKLAPNADDIWLKAMTLINDVKCQLTQDTRYWKSRFLTIQGSNAKTLQSENKSTVGGNDDKLKAVFDYYDLWDKCKP